MGWWKSFVARWTVKLSSQTWWQHLANITMWGIRTGIVVASGYYVVYLLVPTFGAFEHHMYAFLWGSTGSVAIKAITSIIGSETSILDTFAGILK